MATEQDIRFCTTSDGVTIAYSTAGDGPPLVVPPHWVTHLEQDWEDGHIRAFFEPLARAHTVVRYDSRGAGLSDREWSRFSVEALLPDLEAVVDALDVKEISLFGMALAGPLAIAYAAKHPQRVARLALYNSAAHGAEMASDALKDSLINLVRANWGMGSKALADLFVPEPGDDPGYVDAAARRQRNSATPEVAASFLELQYSVDVRHLLPKIDIPTLVIHRRSVRAVPSRFGRELAAGIPGARLMLLEGEVLPPWLGETEPILSALVEFLGPGGTSIARGGFQTILFTDLEGSTALTQRLGDEGALELLRGHNEAVRAALEEHGGHEVKHTGDGIMASFPSAVAAVTAALAMQRDLAGGEVRVRIGLNAGEPIAEDDDLFGLSVIMAARIGDRAEPGQVLVSNVVRELCAGKTFTFTSIGDVTLKGFDEPVALYEVRA